MAGELQGRVVLVTGGGRGLGEAICRTLGAAGATVLAADIRPELAEGVARALQGSGCRGCALKLDVGVEVTAVIAGGMRTAFILDRFPETDPGVLQDPRNVAETVRFVLTQPDESVIPEVMVLPMRETSWP